MVTNLRVSNLHSIKSLSAECCNKVLKNSLYDILEKGLAALGLRKPNSSTLSSNELSSFTLAFWGSCGIGGVGVGGGG